jgi:tRNA 5-methylaminomethyl-2-thiouridine biosynthesis bifunctional protein
MNTRPIRPREPGLVDDTIAEAHDVFLLGSDLPRRWQGRERFVVLDTGFGCGHHFLATWRAWRADAARCERLVFISIESRPFSAHDLRRALAASPEPGLAAQLADAWPPLTHNLHTLSFEDGRVRLMLAFGDVQAWLPELVARVDAFHLVPAVAQRDAHPQEARGFKALARLAAPGATLVSHSAENSVRESLTSAGFQVLESGEARGDTTLARYAPRFTPRQAPSRHAGIASQHHALIVGAGLAGCAVAHALAAEGWTSHLYDRCAGPAQQTSGNPGGLFHGIVNAQDGVHARLLRAAALMAQTQIARQVARGATGAITGMLRLDAGPADALAAVIERQGLPSDYVQAVDAAQASALCGLSLRQAAWHFPGGGWVHPATLAQAWLAEAAPHARFFGGIGIDSLRRAGEVWQVLDLHGRVIDEAQTLVLANAADAARLLGQPGWPLGLARGQISHFARALAPGLVLPSMPVAGAGYVLPEIGGQVVFGATTQPGDVDPTVRDADNAFNLAQLNALLGTTLQVPLQGRVGWRTVARDRLPLVGGVPQSGASTASVDQVRRVPRTEGLFVCTAFASRGITWAALAAHTLASWITGAPAPIEASLLDAIDPARFASRDARRQGPADAPQVS